MIEILGRETQRDELRKDVAVMRELGVVVWRRDEHVIQLGPPPQPSPTDRPPADPMREAERARRAAERRHDTLFAATSTRPRSLEEQRRTLENVVPRGTPAPTRDDGDPQQP